MRCGECGSKNLKKQSVAGRSFHWKDFSSVTMTQPLELSVCQDCKNMIYKSQDIEKIDEAIKASISEQVRLAIARIIEVHGCEQKEIARRLGVSPERLSEVKSGRAIPSFQNFNFLKTMAVDKEAFRVAAPEVHIDFDFKVAMVART